MSLPCRSPSLLMRERLHTSSTSAPSTPPSTYVSFPVLPQPHCSDPRYVYSYTLRAELVKQTPSKNENSFFGLSDIERANCGAKDAAYRSARGAAVVAFDWDSGSVGYGAADDMSTRIQRYYRNRFPKVVERAAASLIAAGLRSEVDPSVALVVPPRSTSSPEAARVERYYRSNNYPKAAKKPAVPVSAESGLEEVGWLSVDSRAALDSGSVKMTSGSTSSSGGSTSSSESTSVSQSPLAPSTTLTSRSTSPTPSLQSAKDKQPEMAENTSEEMKACIIC